MSLYPRNVNEYLVSIGVPRGPNSQGYVVDPVNGADAANRGKNFNQPLASVTYAENLCTADQHDAVVFISGDTADTPAAAIAWDKDFTHLIGMSSPIPGVGQRCRIVGSAAADLTHVVTFSGKGCIVKNIQFYNGADADVDSGAVIESGGRNFFENCAFFGMQHATPGARAGSYSLKVSGEENLFYRCQIGQNTILRAAANAELALASGATRNTFRECHFSSYSETAGKFMVRLDAGVDRWQKFIDCVFENFSVNWANTLTNCFDIDVASTHHVIFQGDNVLVEIDGWADTVTHLYSAAPVPNAGFGVAVQPTS